MAVRGLARKVGDTADEFLEMLLFSEQAASSLHGTFAAGAPHLWGCDFYFCGELNEMMEPGSGYYLLGEARENVEMFWPVDFAVAADKGDGNFFLTRIATANPKEIRGLVRIVPPKCVTLTGGPLSREPWYAETTICGLIGERWLPIENAVFSQRTSGIHGENKRMYRGYDDKFLGEVQDTMMVSFAAMLNARYCWHAAFGFSDNGPRLVLPTNPRGALELFKSRLLAPGEKRRGALRHWVNSHYRDRSDDPGVIDYVREHLRGATRFIWNGLDCELMVSAYDMEKNEAFRVEAGTWRSARQHNRVKLRVKAR